MCDQEYQLRLQGQEHTFPPASSHIIPKEWIPQFEIKFKTQS